MTLCNTGASGEYLVNYFRILHGASIAGPSTDKAAQTANWKITSVQAKD